MVVQIVGYRSFPSQRSGQWIVYHCILPFDESEEKRGKCSGCKTKEFWSQKFFPVEIGAKVDLFFEPDFRGNARLSNIVPRKEEKG